MAAVRALAGLTAVSAFAYAIATEGERQKKAKEGLEGGASSSPSSPAAPKPPVKKELTAEEFNDQQDQEAIKKCMGALEARHKMLAAGKVPTNDKDICLVELYRFLSCPYCAKVKGVFDYHDVPYRTVTVDPIRFSHMPQTPYSMAPQVQLVTDPTAPVGSKARGPFIVDSDLIVTAFAQPLGYSAQLTDPRVMETRKFISNAYSRGTFVAMYSNLNRAMESYRHCVPEHYQYLPLRVAGSLGMSFIASRKAFPKIKEHFEMADGESIDSVVGRQAQYFADRIPQGKPFHGGDKPDIADVEMFAMSHTLLANTQCAPIINKGTFQDWATRMVGLMPNRSTANLGCEMPRL